MEEVFYESLSYTFQETIGNNDVHYSLSELIATYWNDSGHFFDERDALKAFYFQLYLLQAGLYEHDPLWQENLE